MSLQNISKITPPTVNSVIARPRLFHLLEAGCQSSLIWVTAPGGAGKSTLVAHWLAASRRRHLWLRLDAGDNDPASFFHYLGLVAARVFPRRKKPLPHLTPEYSLGLPAFTRRYFEALCTRLSPDGLVIVLDNYQEVAADAPLHDLLPHAVEALAAGVTLVVISRGDCPGSFARLKAGREIAFLGWNEIRFTEEEVGQLLRAAGDAGGERPALAAFLYDQTDGWAAGLRLMLASPEIARLSASAGSEKPPPDLSNWPAVTTSLPISPTR